MQAETAFELVSQLIAHSPRLDNVSVDDLQRLQVRIEEISLPEVMALLEKCRDSGAVIEVELTANGRYVLVQAQEDGWSVGEDLDPPNTFFPDRKNRYSSNEIVERFSRGNIVATFSKQGWSAQWTGWSVEAFTH